MTSRMLKRYSAGIVGFILSTSVHAAMVTHIYELNGTAHDSQGGPDIGLPNPTGLGPTGYTFALEEGPNLSNVVDPTDYSIEMVFQLASIDGYRKLLDFKARSTEEGIYHYSGGLLFYNGIADGPPDGALAVNADQHLVVTRDGSTAQVTIYLNSAQKFSFTDTAGHAVLSGPNRILHLLIDDFNATDHPIGFLDQVRIYQGALTAVQVSALYNGTPPDELLP